VAGSLGLTDALVCVFQEARAMSTYQLEQIFKQGTIEQGLPVGKKKADKGYTGGGEGGSIRRYHRASCFPGGGWGPSYRCSRRDGGGESNY
jgi:hypothetical protein